MLTVPEIQAFLTHKDTNLMQVARDTNLHIQTLYKLRTEGIDPRHSTVVTLSAYVKSKKKKK